MEDYSGPDYSGSDYTDPEYGGSPGGRRGETKLTTAAFVLGIIALIAFQIFFLAIPLGILAVVLALVSRHKSRHFTRRAKFGLFLGLAGCLLSGSITLYALHLLRTNPELLAQVQQVYDYYFDQYGGEGGSGSGSTLPYGSSGGSSDDAGSSSQDDIESQIEDILSGNYRKEKQEQDENTNFL